MFPALRNLVDQVTLPSEQLNDSLVWTDIDSEQVVKQSSLFAELCGVLRAIEIAAQRNWLNLWIETDSSLVVLAFKNSSLIPWSLRNRWPNCQVKLRSMNFM
ncbi:ribonuclease H protein, partial [Trifolium medium]|nr:ribonuclease H protein [Trifolium medium]